MYAPTQISYELLAGLSLGIRGAILMQGDVLKAISHLVERAQRRGETKPLDLLVMRGLLERAGIYPDPNPR